MSDYPGDLDRLVDCRLCEKPNTALPGTKLCNRCWELERRMLADPVLAARVMEEHRKEFFYARSGVLEIHDLVDMAVAAGLVVRLPQAPRDPLAPEGGPR